MRDLTLIAALLFSAGIVFAQDAQEAQEEATPALSDAVTETVTPTRTPARPTTTPTTIGKTFFELKDLKEDSEDNNKVTGYSWTVSTQYAGWKANSDTYPTSAVKDKDPEKPVYWTTDSEGKKVLTEAGQERYNYLKANTKIDGGKYNLSSTLVRYDKDSFSYTVFDASGTNTEWEATLSVKTDADGNVVMEESKHLVNYQDVYDDYWEKNAEGKWELKQGEFLRRVYYFSFPVGEVEYWQKNADGSFVLDDDGKRIALESVQYPVTELGVKVNGLSSVENPTSGNLFYVIDDKQVDKTKNYYLAFGTPETGEDGRYIRKDPEIAFGQPLPAPLATLLIALGFGAAFVVYRNRKQAKA